MPKSQSKLHELQVKLALNETYRKRLETAEDELRLESVRWNYSFLIGLSISFAVGAVLFLDYTKRREFEYPNRLGEFGIYGAVITTALVLTLVAFLSWSVASFFRYLEVRRCKGLAADAKVQASVTGYQAERVMRDARLVEVTDDD